MYIHIYPMLYFSKETWLPHNEQTLNSISSKICILLLPLPAPFWTPEIDIIGFLSNFPHSFASFSHKFFSSLSMANDTFMLKQWPGWFPVDQYVMICHWCSLNLVGNQTLSLVGSFVNFQKLSSTGDPSPVFHLREVNF